MVFFAIGKESVMTATGHGTNVRRPSGSTTGKKKPGAEAGKAARITRQKSAVRKIMARYPNALRELAK
jgi:hypothetical protein